MKINHIFLRHFMTPDIQEPGMPTTESGHTYEFYTEYLKYSCPVDPEWHPNQDYEVSVTPTVSYNAVEMEPVMKKDCLNVVWVPMHYPTWRWFNDYLPDTFIYNNCNSQSNTHSLIHSFKQQDLECALSLLFQLSCQRSI